MLRGKDRSREERELSCGHWKMMMGRLLPGG